MYAAFKIGKRLRKAIEAGLPGRHVPAFNCQQKLHRCYFLNICAA